MQSLCKPMVHVDKTCLPHKPLRGLTSRRSTAVNVLHASLALIQPPQPPPLCKVFVATWDWQKWVKRQLGLRHLGNERTNDRGTNKGRSRRLYWGGKSTVAGYDAKPGGGGGGFHNLFSASSAKCFIAFKNRGAIFGGSGESWQALCRIQNAVKKIRERVPRSRRYPNRKYTAVNRRCQCSG